MHKNILSYRPLQQGDTLGIFTPSSPGYKWNEGLFTNGLKNLENMGFKIKIRESQKLVCGFSDVTSLHLAILKFAGLRAVYGPSVMCWFGEWPNGVPESTKWFLDAVTLPNKGFRKITPPKQWSNHKRDWSNEDWKKKPRLWNHNEGWRVLNPGSANGEILALNFNTLMSAAGTPYWPDFKGKILLLEDMEAPLSRTERHLQQLKFTGAFEEIQGLLIGKPENYNQEGALFNYDDLFKEIIGPRPYPIVSNFDCSHTLPMISMPQLSPVKILASGTTDVIFSIRSDF